MLFNKTRNRLAVFLLLIFLGCSTQKDAMFNRWYHKLNTKYNGLFYAKEHLNAGINKVNDAHNDNYQKILTINTYADLKASKSAQSQLDQAIEKSTQAIKQHSMDIDGEEKNKLIPEAYMVIGTAQFYKKEYLQAINTFNYISRKSTNTEIQTDALLWVARSQTQSSNIQAAQKTINIIETDYYLNKNQESDFFQIKSEISLAQEDFVKARLFLHQAISLTRNKKLKARMFYVLGQIGLIEEDYEFAWQNFHEVIKRNPSYELVFNAKLNQTKTYNPNKNNFNQLRSQLDKMIKDKKNTEYKDQIYFSLANMELKNLDTIAALRALELSTLNSTTNNNQKLESHFLLANIYWKNKSYVKSYNHCDSAYSLVDSKNDQYYSIKSMLRSSKKIAKLYTIINYNDSIIKLAKLPKEELNKIIDEYIDNLKLQEQAQKQLNETPNSSRFNSYEFNKQAQNNMNITSGGGWYFYNPSAISLGYSEFLSRWGNRKLEDNWRRKNKNQLISSEDTLGLAVNNPSETEKYSRDYYLSKLPLKQEDQLRLFSQIETSYYDLASIFKSDMSDYDQAISLYVELLERFPSSDYKQLIYFDLYSIYNVLQDTVGANSFLNKIKIEFPESSYIDILSGEGAAQIKLENDKKTYRTAHDLYLLKKEDACQEISLILQKDTNNVFFAQIELLYVFCDAQKQTKREFITSLENIYNKYLGTEISQNIEPILLELKGEEATVDQSGYINEPDAEHFFLVVLYDTSIHLPTVQKSISDFNNNNYKLDSLQLSNLLLNKEIQLLRIESFANKKEAMIYYDLITAKIKEESMFNNTTPIVIGEDNFIKLLKDKNISDYIAYFNAIYLLN